MTPSDSPRGDLERRTDTLLGWPSVLGALADRAATPLGKERCLAVAGVDDTTAASGQYRDVAEWATLRERSGDLSLASGLDPRPALRAAVVGGQLDGEQCRDVAVLLDVAHGVHRALITQSDLPGLQTRASRLDPLPDLRRELWNTVDAQGRLRESATPELRRLRLEVDRLRRMIVERVDGLLRSPTYEPWLQDTFVTERQDRYVLPIKIEHRGKVPGIVHELSASGATVFIEPQELVEANNDLKWAELAVGQEIERIFRHVTDQIAARRHAIDVTLDALTALDVIQAKGRLGLAYDGAIPTVSADRSIVWPALRHPLLALRGTPVVANDVRLEPATRALIISGPNTGGKTVLLKAIGLAALMTRAGIPLPCGQGAVSPLFPAVLMDGGDDQDLSRDLSTFAAHIRVISTLLDVAPAGSLILLDELATATDPDEGAALSQAVIEALMARDVLTVATTHFASLKAWATEGSERGACVSAGMGYDVDAMTPTYRLSLGRPGPSLGLDVAARLGLPASVLDRARALVSPQSAALSRAVAALDRERAAAAAAAEHLAALEDAAREAALRQDAAAADLERQRDAFAASRRQRLDDEVRRARRELDAILEAARRESDPRKIRGLAARAATVAASPDAEHVDEHPPEATEDFEAGAPVRVASLRATGVLLDSTRGRTRVRVRMGDREVSVPTRELRPGPAAVMAPRSPGGPPAETGPRDAGADTVNVIGQRVADALAAVDRALDQRAVAGAPGLRVLHGHGTGRLKAAIRAHLAESPYVASHRPGDDVEGGDAVTIVSLRHGA